MSSSPVRRRRFHFSPRYLSSVTTFHRLVGPPPQLHPQCIRHLHQVPLRDRFPPLDFVDEAMCARRLKTAAGEDKYTAAYFIYHPQWTLFAHRGSEVNTRLIKPVEIIIGEIEQQYFRRLLYPSLFAKNGSRKQKCAHYTQ